MKFSNMLSAREGLLLAINETSMVLVGLEWNPQCFMMRHT